jgi:hypothetical protein
MNHFQLARFFWILGLLYGCTGHSELDEPVGTQAERVKLPELSQEPLAPAVSLTSDYFRQSYPHLSAEQFQQKWKNAQKSGLLFMRSFVNTWYDELGRISSTGPIGPCFGDPHPENFGFLLFGDLQKQGDVQKQAETLEYTYNDADDSGSCPVAFDALRYFTTLKIMLRDNDTEADLRRAYVRFLNGEELSDRPSAALRPDVTATRNRMLTKATKKNKIKIEGPVTALSPAKAQALFGLLQPQCVGCQFLDAAEFQVSSGGSAGLKRYWILVEAGPQKQEIIEFKELTEPASQRGRWAQKNKLSRSDILKDLWGKEWPTHWAFVSFEARPFLMRSRMNADLALETLNAEQKKAVLTEQVYQLAQLHKKTLTGNTLLEEWLGRQSEFQARRYSEALLAAQGG